MGIWLTGKIAPATTEDHSGFVKAWIGDVMFGLGKKTKAIKILRKEFDLERGEILDAILDIMISPAENEYDAAFYYIIGRALSITAVDKATEALLDSDLALVILDADFATNPEEIRRRAKAAREFRLEQSKSWYPTFGEWLDRFKIVCGETNPMLSPSADGGSMVDFMDHSGLRRAHANRVAPDRLAKDFAPTFHPDTFGR